MTKSYNGWSASPNPADFGGLAQLVVAGESFAPGVRAGDVHTVLEYVATQLHLRVEPVVRSDWHQADDWGYNYRPNTNNPSQISTHGSGTSIDYNATRHPNGAKNTFTADQYREIDRILAEVDNVVVQLRGFDEMHFEISGNEAAVARVAVRLRGASKPAPAPVAKPAGKRVLYLTNPNMVGEDVKAVQQRLHDVYPGYRHQFGGKLISVDSQFGPETDRWVREFQRRALLVVDGEVGPATLKGLRL